MAHQVTSSVQPFLASLGRVAPSCTKQAFDKCLQNQGVHRGLVDAVMEFQAVLSTPPPLPLLCACGEREAREQTLWRRRCSKKAPSPKLIFLRSLHQAAEINLLFLGIINFAHQH